MAYLGFYNKCLLSDIDTVDNLVGGLCYPHHRLERLIFIRFDRDRVISLVFFQLFGGLRSGHPYLHCSSLVLDPSVRRFYRDLLYSALLSS